MRDFSALSPDLLRIPPPPPKKPDLDPIIYRADLALRRGFRVWIRSSFPTDALVRSSAERHDTWTITFCNQRGLYGTNSLHTNANESEKGSLFYLRVSPFFLRLVFAAYGGNWLGPF